MLSNQQPSGGAGSDDRGEPSSIVAPVSGSRVFGSMDERANGEERTRTSAAWSDPRPLPHSGVPPFPVEALPAILRAWVHGQSDFTQTSPDLAALIALAAVSVAASKMYVIEDPWQEPINLWTALVIPAASRASAVVSAAVAPIVEFERDLRGLEQARLHSNAVNRMILEKKWRIELEQAAFADEADKRFLHGASAADLQQRISGLRGQQLPRLLSDDASPQAVVTLLGANHGRLGIISSEDGPFTRLVGLATRCDNDLSNMLRSHNGEGIAVDRVGRDPVAVEAPAVTLGLRLHDHLLRTIRSHEGLRASGLLGRFLLAVPESRVGFRSIEAKRPGEAVDRTYGSLLKDLLTRSDAHLRAGKAPIGLTLDQGAHDRFRQVRLDVEAQLRPEGALAPIADWAGKLCGLVLRLAALLHVARHSPHVPVEISGETMEAAVCIAIGYAVPHARTVILGEAQSIVVERAARVVEWLATTRLDQVTQRQVHRRFQSVFDRSKAVVEVLALLEAHGHVRRLPSPPRPRGGWSSPTFEVNPEVRRVSRVSTPAVTPVGARPCPACSVIFSTKCM